MNRRAFLAMVPISFLPVFKTDEKTLSIDEIQKAYDHFKENELILIYDWKIVGPYEFANGTIAMGPYWIYEGREYGIQFNWTRPLKKEYIWAMANQHLENIGSKMRLV